MTIYFYSTKDKYGEFSNFSNHGVKLDGKWWQTTEHYYQAQKFEDDSYKETVRNATTPKTAANLGRSHDSPIKDNWEEIKEEIMKKRCY